MMAWLKAQFHREVAYPPGPEGVVHYAVGDIHGRLDCLNKAHAMIDRDIDGRIDRAHAIEVYLGDYVDRGPQSKGVIDCLLARAAAAPVVLLRGNHELAMEAFLRGELPFADWRPMGGLETVLSYGVDVSALRRTGSLDASAVGQRMPASHLGLLSSLRNVYVAGQYCYVHAGLRPGVALEKQSIEDLVWIRDEFLNFRGDFGFIVVHGHTPVSDIEFRPNRVNTDTGAFATNRLSVVRIDADGVSAVDDNLT